MGGVSLPENERFFDIFCFLGDIEGAVPYQLLFVLLVVLLVSISFEFVKIKKNKSLKFR